MSVDLVSVLCFRAYSSLPKLSVPSTEQCYFCLCVLFVFRN